MLSLRGILIGSCATIFIFMQKMKEIALIEIELKEKI